MNIRKNRLFSFVWILFFFLLFVLLLLLLLCVQRWITHQLTHQVILQVIHRVIHRAIHPVTHPVLLQAFFQAHHLAPQQVHLHSFLQVLLTGGHQAMYLLSFPALDQTQNILLALIWQLPLRSLHTPASMWYLLFRFSFFTAWKQVRWKDWTTAFL